MIRPSYDEAPIPASVDRPAGALLAAAIGAAALGLLWLCVGQLASAAAPSLSARAWSALMRANTPGDQALADRDARAALRQAPLDVQALVLIALEADRRGDRRRARAIMALCGARTWRDPISQTWLFSDALRRGDYEAASVHADAALRRNPDLGRYLFPVMIRAMADPLAVGPDVARLADAPDWRRGFLGALTGQGANLTLARQVYQALYATAAPPTDAESAGLVSRLVADRKYQAARDMWSRGPGPAAGRRGLVNNGDFQAGGGAPPFNWRLADQDGAGAEMDTADDGFAALSVHAPPAGAARLAEQLLVLPPGAYRLSGAALIQPDPAGAIFAWQVACISPPGSASAEAVAAEMRMAAGRPGWRVVAATFSVPATGCEAQWLRLSSLAHDGFDSADAWFRSIRLEPLGGPSAAGHGGRLPG